MTHAPTQTLTGALLAAAGRWADRPALEVEGSTLSYTELLSRAASIAEVLADAADPSIVDAPTTAILAHRSATAFAGILASLLHGTAYVPLHPDFPAERTADMLTRSGAASIIVGAEALEILPEVLGHMSSPITVVVTGAAAIDELSARWPEHDWRQPAEPGSASVPAAPEVSPDTAAYLLFTSGSTGRPKGVAVSHASILTFIDIVSARYEITEEDRFSQMFELVFDLSLFDMFVAWTNGACVCCPSKGDAKMPARYISESGITIWFSVPSLGMAMQRMRMLRPGAYPGLRVSLFCGEALVADLASAWQAAAPESIVENVYGPTEATLACTAYRWDAAAADQAQAGDVVPIGHAFPGTGVLVVDSDLKPVTAGEAGELLLSGPQLAIGYWRDAEKTAAAFLVPPGQSERHYRTGDLVAEDAETGVLRYLGRIDHQVKIRGHRVELGEIEAAIRTVDGVHDAVVLGWPPLAESYDGVAAFVQASDALADAIDGAVRGLLPEYMVPRVYRFVETYPLNSNGKIDRGALRAALDESERTRAGAAR